ncbi:hypothetical protein KM1_327080 [Entamoeba histolytica HM-3:IMSS]|nr:hypothetical protein KM1_327080 [Entamoeba histolytica HM-3:IMSS]GAT92460.1 hypothetical protein CL6EHI_092270 [Entamoeba histolytica]
MKVLKYIFNILLMICGVCFVALSGYYIYELSFSIREGEQIFNLIVNALAVLVLNFLMITMWLACIFSNRKMFLNVFIISGTSAVVTIIQFALSITLKSSCNNDNNYVGYQAFCDTFANFSWMAPVIITFVLDVLTAIFSIIRFAFYRKWEWD